MEGEQVKMSNIEWGLLIGALLFIDLIQIILDLFAIGIALNRMIDILVGLSLGFYLHLRGQSMATPKRLFGVMATFGLELIPVIDAFPLWCLDGVYNFILWRHHKKEVEKANQKRLEEERKRQIKEYQIALQMEEFEDDIEA